MRKLTVKEGGVPPGEYVARFTGIEDTNHIEYGAGLWFKFEICTGTYEGSKVSRITNATPTLGNSAGKMLSGLLGRALTKDEELEIDSLIGKDYMVTVEATSKGGTRVRDVRAMMPV